MRDLFADERRSQAILDFLLMQPRIWLEGTQSELSEGRLYLMLGQSWAEGRGSHDEPPAVGDGQRTGTGVYTYLHDLDRSYAINC